MAEITLVEAVNLALHHEMTKDSNVVVLGEDVGDNGGVFRATIGLKQKFGLRRVIDTPLAEALIGGVAVGMAFKAYVPLQSFNSGFVFQHLNTYRVTLLVCATAMRKTDLSRCFQSTFGGGIHAQSIIQKVSKRCSHTRPALKW